MFVSLSRCAKHMTKLYSLEVSVTVQGHGIYPWSWCLLHISWTLWKFFIKLYPNVPLSETVCRSNDSATITLKCHGHISRSLQFSVWSYHLSSLNVCFLNSLKCSPQWDVVQNSWLSNAQSRKGMEFTLQFCVRSIASEPFERFSLNFTPLFLSMRRCADARSKLHFDAMGFCSGVFSCPSNCCLVQIMFLVSKILRI